MSPSGPRGAFHVVDGKNARSAAAAPDVAEMVRQGIQKAQEKLIDLSLRNGMLNYKHSETSSRHVRIIDEQIAFLVDALNSGRSLDILPLPPVEQVPRDEDTDAFRAALKTAKEIDPEWLAAEDARRAAGNRRRARDKAAERALRDRVRAQLGMPEWRIATDPKARAKDLGINPDYDLPPPATKSQKHHTDDTLQTLFFPDRLEAKLSTLHSAARALQEDAGLSALHCAVGFLEWYDPVDAPDPAYAPLLLLPVNMEKRISQGEYIYSILGRDDDEAVNVALREKLKQLALDLPEYDPDTGVEAFLKQVERTIRNRPRWRVRRFATVGLFSFARQVMWADLDPTKWPVSARPESHPLLGEIYGDVGGDHAESVAPVYDVDDPALEQQAPALVTDADASQLSAVIDAAGGKNLVIQGPPGTGKSQAITNIIANALWHGKTVLFVSEKMAALKVVKDRLDHMGLGEFCLAVHSAKASKSLVLKAIRERMESPRVRSNAQVVERARDALHEARRRLTEYATLMNSPAGETGLTVHQVLWGDFTRSVLPETVPDSALEFRLLEPLAIDRFKLGELIGAGRALDELAASMGAFAEPHQQPWRGIGNLNLTRFDRTKAIELIQQWSAELENLRAQAAAFVSASGWTRPASLGDLTTACATAREIPDPPPHLDARVLSYAVDGDLRQSLSNWADRALRAEQYEIFVARITDRRKLEANLDLAARLATKARELRVSEATPTQLETLADQAQQDAEGRAAVVQLIADVLAIVRPDPKREIDFRAEAMVAGYLYHIARLSPEHRRWRASALNQDAVAEALMGAETTAGEVRAAAAEAGFDDPMTPHFAELLPSVSELRRAAATLRGAGIWARFGREWRTAKVIWRQTFPSEKKLVRLEAGRRLMSAALCKEKIATLEANHAAKLAAGRHWRSADTPFAELIAVAHWMKSVRNTTPLAEPGAKELRRLACEANSEEFSAAIAFSERAKDLKVLDAFKAAHAERSSILRDAGRLAERASALKTLLRETAIVGLHENQQLKNLPSAIDAVAKLQDLSRAMAAEPGASVASSIPAVTDAERAKIISSALAHAERLLAAELPGPVIEHLLAMDCAGRTAAIKQRAKEIQDDLARERDVLESAQRMLTLRLDDWCGGPLDAVSFDALITKCQKAIQNPDALEKQIDLLSTELEADGLGLGDLLRHWTAKGVRYAGVGLAIEAVFYRSVAEKLMRELPVLARHAGNTHEQVRARFQKLDREILELNRDMIAAKLQGRPVPPGRRAQSVRDYTDNEMLSHQTGLQQPRIALRRLFSNAGDAIRAYTPCLMMSPMSVAQYLEPGKHTFDILVVDEASQMKPENALGALMRCSQAVIVGDPQQLPPTDFFAVTSDGDGQNAAQDGPEESILELGRRCWHPMRMLEVHYRSRHQSLIAYSNREFYDERLLVYPSPVLQDPAYGVSCHRVEGAYEVGQGRNRIEAEAVVEEAARLMRAHFDRSLGVVAINQAQSDLIETLMDQRVASDPELQAYKQKWNGELEEFFIKNLENVQGDERDTILISTVYGRTAEGVFHQHFGPINRSYGHRRLNVLFTRAKCKLTVFTSLDHGQIVADGSSRGVRVLKEFLEYAAHGTITPGRSIGAPPDSDFERWFLSRLKAEGYDAHPQVGVAKYRIDIGVVHPDRQGSYILGVECDGATYHSSKAARDRDRLRQDVLEGLNWKIHRVWSTDWYRNPEREFRRLVQNIEKLRAVN